MAATRHDGQARRDGHDGTVTLATSVRARTPAERLKRERM
jgi:hypothetical protein